ncbi:hypothetical protein MUU72_03580 [Streptomyces sp. RS10V-4]|uniref:hypothetical protein n=1 Tax=Streptomyces rhizoryzae TaxID=2932493 RepID=UPI002004E022|nr:hypothetical protein [Streptomyces rhizoryzae]MCK7622215.1 hypothetical protein [Streptomyces rhizoryzae]
MEFKKGDHVRFSPRPDTPERNDRGTVVDVAHGRKGEAHYEVRRDADPSGPSFFFAEGEIEKT